MKNRLIVRCYAGCQLAEVLRKAGLKMSDLFPPDESNAYGKGTYTLRAARREVARYDYTDEAGVVLYQKVRYEPKDFRQRRPDGKGGWSWDLEGVRRVLFRLPQLVVADLAELVLLVEGEKDVLTAERLGFLATTASEGAGSGWEDDTYPALLRGRNVVVIPDNDRPGILHAKKVLGALMMGEAASLRIVHLTGVPEHGDLTDWVEAGGCRSKLLALINTAKTWRC